MCRPPHPTCPGGPPNAKHELLGLCARSRSGAIRNDVTASGTRTGPLYATRINEFASTVWNVAEAEVVSQSLRHAVARIRQISADSG